MNLEAFGHEIIDRIHRAWCAEQGQYTFSSSGFAVFYSPLVARCRLMIVGFNPGGKEEDFNLEASLKVPSIHEYFSKEGEYRLAREMRGLFRAMGVEEVLRESVKLNLIPFRSASKRQWRGPEIGPGVRQRLEELSKDVFLSVLAEVSPHVVLTEGIETYAEMITWFRDKGRAIVEDEPVRGTRARRLYLRAQFVDGPRLIGIPHLSWPLPAPDRLRVGALLAADLGRT